MNNRSGAGPSGSPFSPATLVELLRRRAAEQPGRTAYTFLADGEAEEGLSLTYGQLDERARSIAGWLQQVASEGDRVLVLYPPGADYVAALFGCLYAGMVAVPAYPPRRNHNLLRLQALARDARANVALTAAQNLEPLQAFVGQSQDLRALRCYDAEVSAAEAGREWRETEITDDRLALLQYTSGSTGTPKGVMLSHRNLLHNSRLLAHGFEYGADSHCVSWLPVYHDMGLIGGVLQPLYGGYPCTLMSPAAFIQRPARWLRAISGRRRVISGGPNFAYALCASKVGAEQRESLDLSGWDVAFNGAEPIRPETLEEFARVFKPCGFRREAFYTCYGLAEATLIVTGARRSSPPVVKAVRKSELEKNLWVEAPDGEDAGVEEGVDARVLVGSGRTLPGQNVRIVDPETRARCEPGRVGEIWVAGPSVARGYWDNPSETERTFQARLADTGEAPFLRTGDLGVISGGELFVTGRLKDLIIIRGLNHYPQDIERTVERCHAALRPHGGATFSIEDGGEERLVVVHEVDPRGRPDLDEVVESIRREVSREHELEAHAVALVRRGSVPKTSSGKVQRRACRSYFLEGRLDLVKLWRQADAPDDAGLPSLEPAAELHSAEEVEAWLVANLAAGLRMDAAQIDATQPVTRYGLDSLRAIELAHRLETSLGVSLPLTSFLESPSVSELASSVCEQLRAKSEAPAFIKRSTDGAEAGATEAGEHAATHGQRALWFLHKLAPESPAYNVARAVRVRSELDAGAVRRAFQTLADRHPALRTTFHMTGEGLRQLVHERGEVGFRYVDASAWGAEELERHLTAESRARFDLEAGPLMRVTLLKRSPREHVLLLVTHHIVTDFWSMGVLAEEFGALYRAEVSGVPSAPHGEAAGYAEHARRQEELLGGPEGECLWSYWREQLAGAPTVLELPTDRPRPTAQTYRGASLRFRVGEELTRRLASVGAEHGATLYTTLLAAFGVLLRRYTGQTDLLVGSPLAGRERAETAGVLGYFVNTVPLRADLSGDPSFVALLGRVRRAVLGAARHQAYPFALMVERLQPARDPSRSPLFQVAFVLQQSPRGDDEPGLAEFALGEDGAVLNLGGLALESVALETRVAQFDLSLSMARTSRGLVGSLEYSTDLFDEATVERVVRNFQTLLEAVAADAQQKISALPLLSEEEHERLRAWNSTGAPLPGELCAHRLFEQQAARTPKALAVSDGHVSLSYGELNERANVIAHELIRRGVGVESRVGVLTGPSADFVVSALAAMKAGAAYLPLDPALPQERLRFMLDESAARVVLAQSDLLGRLSPEWAEKALRLDEWPGGAGGPRGARGANNPAVGVAPENAAYVIYTSGSTGTPKGVVVEHRGLVNLIEWTRALYHIQESDRASQVAGLGFDAAVWEVWSYLAAGASVHVAGAEERADTGRLAEWIRGRGVTVSFMPTPLAEAFLSRGTGGGGAGNLRALMTGGDALKLRPEAGLTFEMFNHYGPTECTVIATSSHVRASAEEAGVPSIGRPVSNTEVYLLDEHLQLVPVGAVGELYIGGAGVARGYLNRPELTAERFVPDALSGEAGARLYRTGDLARYLPTGEIEFLGRLDSQVKVRGFRIELGEIEARLSRHPSVAACAVVAREDGRGAKRLVAYVVPAEQGAADASALRSYMKEALPDYMLPSAFVALAELPLTPNGKVDRRALPEPASAGAEEYAAPRTPVEEVLAAVWADVLGVGQVGRDANFFELGGHSLLAAQVVSRLRGALGVELPLRAVFEEQTVEALSARVEQALRAGNEVEASPIEPVGRAGALPLSYAQQRLWFMDQLAPGGAAYNVPAAVRLKGRLDAAVLARTFTEIVRRHESLRTTFTTRGEEPVQVVHDAPDFELPVVDLRGCPDERREREAARLALEEARRPFDLARGPLLRASLLRTGEDEYVLLATMHHIVSDGWSIGVLVREVAALYESYLGGQASPLGELPVQYADYAVWQRGLLRGEALERQLAYWKEQLKDAPAALELPTDRPRPPAQTFRGATETRALPPELTRALKRLCREEGATLFMTLLAAFQTLLARYTGRREIVVGSAIAGRGRQELEGLIGCFVNTLVLRAGVDEGMSFRELLRQAREVCLAAYAHGDVPFEMLVEELQPERDLSRSPLFQVAFAMQESPLERFALPGVSLSRFEVEERTAKFDLTLTVSESAEALEASLNYNTDLFDRDTVGRMLRHFKVLLEGVAADASRSVGELPLSDEEELEQLRGWNSTAAPLPGELCAHRLFERQAARAPEALAVSDANVSLSYGELNERANVIAHELMRRGVGVEDRVALLTGRTVGFVAGALGVMKAGAAYVPLDASHPAERLSYMLEAASAKTVVTEEGTLASLPAGWEAKAVCLDALDAAGARDADNPDARVTASNAAYVIYTSGSTGRPKGVVVEHRSLVNLIEWTRRVYEVRESDRASVLYGLGFDAAVWEVWPYLAAGASVHVAGDEERTDGRLLKAWLEGRDITLSCVPTSIAEVILQERWGGRLRVMYTGGGQLKTRPRDGHAFPFFNVYGPTEATVLATAGEVEPAGRGEGLPSIGRPMANVRVYILDRRMRQTPVGVPGELYIGGVGVARGYLNRPELTAERFVPDPLGAEPGARLYRTGDLARYLPTGEIEFLGRLDSQVKVRGFRVELGEIEAVLAEHAGVREAVVVARGDGAARGGGEGVTRLVAYVVASDEEAALDAGELRGFLRTKLPDYMIPQTFVRLPALPLTPNGKIDVRALPEPARATGGGYTAPRTETEEALAALWSQVLGVGRVGVEDNFFELGGHSLLATQLASRVRERFGVEFPLRRIFESPTVALLAGQLEKSLARREGLEAPPIRPRSLEGHPPLSFAQQRLWFMEQLQPGGSVFQIPGAARLTGPLNVEALERSLNEIMRRHETLRTTFGIVEGRPVQLVAPEPTPLRIETVDIRSHTAAEREALVEERAAEEVRRPFDLARGPLLRAGLLRTGEEEHFLFFTTHHIVSDGWSMGVLIREVAALYEEFDGGARAALPELTVQYADFSVWQQEWLRGETLEKQLAYWRGQLGGRLPTLKLPTSRPRPAVQTYGGARHPVEFDAGLVEALRELGAKTRASLFMTLLAGFQALLHRYTRQRDIVVGTGIANRNRIETEPLIGYFVNLLALRTDLSGDPSFGQLLERVREVTLGAYAHQDLPFEKLVEELQPERDLSRPPFFQVMLVLQNTPHEPLQLPGLRLEVLDIDSRTAKMDLTVTLTETGRGLTGWLEYNTDLFDAPAAAAIVENLETLLRAAARDPEQNISRLHVSDGESQDAFGGQISAARIEAALVESGAAAAALVVGHEGEGEGDGRLVAYVVPAEGAAVSAEELRAAARERLPEHMIPDAFVTVEEMPLTPDGRIDWGALPRPAETEAEADTAFVAPRTPTEEAVAAVWAEVLELPRVGIHHKFFDIGGDSLKVVRVSLMLNELYPEALTVVDLFKHNTVASVSAHIDGVRASREPAPAIQGFEL